ncbi:MAG: hypothetical protein CSB44_01060 [Gammaproteobacteria bacterium]|nr:MAG: hypothetical protein CSB44_01060 [Gammaproteobacteria bacterium]
MFMTRVLLPASLFGAVVCSLAWLLGQLLAPYHDFEEPSIIPDLNQDQIDELTVALESRVSHDIRSLDEIGLTHGVFIQQILDCDESDFGTDSGGEAGPGCIEADAETNLPIPDEPWFDGDALLIELADGRRFEILSLDDSGEFTYGQWPELLLQLLAMLLTLAIVGLLLMQRLRPLESVVRANAQNEEPPPTDDLVDAVLSAFRQLESRVQALKEQQRSIAADHRDLLASVAHEFRSPLARLQFANEMAMERSGDEQKALFLEANSAAEELDDLVRETLSYSRLSSPDDNLRMEAISLYDFFRSMVTFPIPADSEVELRVEYPVTDEMIRADKRLLERAVGNLLGNAIRHAEHLVTLTCDLSKESLEILVRDDGPGIPAMHHQWVFEPFYRVERSRSRDSGGFGLGLSIVKSICDKHGAEVLLSSDETGTTVTIRWPSSLRVAGLDESSSEGHCQYQS